MARVIMIQGTMSGAGKSLLTAGLLRIFREDGYRAAPFKSQNMALNSYVTSDGLEMGRAQAVQAEAAGIEPSVYMNPILLKPTNDVGSQVIVNGEVIGNMKARDYFAYKKELIPEVLRAFEMLDKMYDIIVVEGAGSPAEINLKENDIVNMGLAKLLHAPVILAGDIDRGGVFAQLYGTVELLEEEERQLIKGLIINKFRGDKSILDPGIEMLEEKTHKRVIGTIPYMDVDIEEEDSLSERLEGHRGAKEIDIAVVRFPRISNYTDLAPLEHLNGVSVRYIGRAEELGNPALIILPGSKNTIRDLKWMRESGIETAVKKAVSRGTFLFGICGGFQMLGMEITDEIGCESAEHEQEDETALKTMRGMELLPISTAFSAEKSRTRVLDCFPKLFGPYEGLSGKPFEGYEIHMGQSVLLENETEEVVSRWKNRETGTLLGVCKEQIMGTYVHGVFDREETAGALLEELARARGIAVETLGVQDFKKYKEEQYTKLAAQMRRHLDMKAIYEMLEQGEAYEGTIGAGTSGRN